MKSTEAMTRGSARPRVGAGFEPAAGFGDAFAVKDLELEAELRGEFRLPLLDDGRRADDQYPGGAAAGVEFAQDEAGFDGLAETNVVGNQQTRARQFERPERRDLLVGFKCDAGTRGRDKPVIARRQAEADGVHQKLEPREAPRVGQVEFGNFVRLDLFDWV